MSSFYELRLLNIPHRYKLAQNVLTILKAYDDFKSSHIDEAAVGRLIRLSPNNRASVVETIVKVAEIMHKKPEESGYCLAVIKTCGEVIKIAGKFHMFEPLVAQAIQNLSTTYTPWFHQPDAPT